MLITEKVKSAVQQLPFLLQAIRLLWGIAPGSTVLWIILIIIQGLLPVAIVFLTKAIVDNLVLVIGVEGSQTGQNFSLVFIPVGLMIGVLILTAILRSWLSVIRTNQSQLIQNKISELIQEKSVSLDLSYYESAEYFDKLHRAQNDASHRPVELLESLTSLLQNSLTLIAMASVLIPFGLWAPIALLISTLPVLYVVIEHRLRNYSFHYNKTNQERHAWYYNWLLTTRQNAAEIRMLGLGTYFKKAFQMLREALRRESLQLQKAQALSELLASFFALLVTGGAMGWMVWRAMNGIVTLGDLALFYQAFNQGQRLLRTLLENIGQMYSNSLFLGDLFEFFDLEAQLRDPESPEPLPDKLNKGITFSKVNFSYPLSKQPVLENFDLHIEAGKITALVGANGAGKSTLVKLLCRLYDAQSGSVLFDDINIKHCSTNDIRKMITVLFQEPIRFNGSIAENIGLGNLTDKDNSTLVEEAAELSGADTIIAKLPDGDATLLGRWFTNSTDLSGGEWQRIALARAFFRKSPIIILDEPTGSMDSWSEMDWIKRFKGLAQGRTALIIAHRFTTAMQADMIHVMDNGKIVESGNHSELLSLSGRYAASWTEQMRNS